MKKLMAAFAALTLAATAVVPVYVSAAETTEHATFSLSANVSEASANDVVKVTFSIDENTGLNSWEGLIDFDLDAFEYLGAELCEGVDEGPYANATQPSSAADFYANVTEKNDKTLKGAWANGTGKIGSGYTKTGNIFVMSFKVKDTAADGDYTIRLRANPEQIYKVVYKDPADTQAGTEKSLVPFSTNNATVKVANASSTVKVTGVTIDPKEISLEEGETANVTAVVSPEDADNKEYNFSSSDDKVATVSADGVVTAVAEGTCNIIVTTKDGGKTDTCKVTVVKKKVPVEGVSVEPAELKLVKGDVYQRLVVTVTPDNATNKKYTFSSSDESVAKVSDLGTVTAEGVGECTITVTTEDGQKTATVKVTVRDDMLKLVNEEERHIVMYNDETASVKLDVAEGTNIEVKSDTEDVTATYDAESKTVKIVPKAGAVVENAVIGVDASDADGFTDRVEITVEVRAHVDTVEFNTDEIELRAGKSYQSKWTVSPDNAYDKSVTFETSDPTVATIDKDGNIVGVAEGECEVKVISVDNPDAFDTMKVTVLPADEFTVYFKENPINIDEGERVQLELVVDPENEELSDLTNWTFSSDDKQVAAVNKFGQVVGYTAGTAIIYATNPDYVDKETGEVLTVSCVVNVRKLFPAYTNGRESVSNEVGRATVSPEINIKADSSSSGPIAATGGEFDSVASNAPAIAAAALGVIALGFVVVARKKRRS